MWIAVLPSRMFIIQKTIMIMHKTFDFDKIYDELLTIEQSLQVIRTWTEDFEDEDTHEVITLERSEVTHLRQPNAVEALRIAELEDVILQNVATLTDEQLQTMYYRTEKLVFLREGIQRQLAWAINDDADDINDVTYNITSTHPESLDAIETLIDEVCQRVGMPENIADGLSMFVPYSSLMQVLTGESQFVGFVERKERTSDALILQCDCPRRSIAALAEALTEVFGVKVEICL